MTSNMVNMFQLSYIQAGSLLTPQFVSSFDSWCWETLRAADSFRSLQMKLNDDDN